jgi:hypothetical protein
MNYTDIHRARRSQSGSVFILLVLMIIVLLATINVLLGDHAMKQHPDTAPLTRECLKKNGVWKAYQEPKSSTFHWLCKDPQTGTIFDMIVEKVDELTYREKSAFMPKDGSWNQIFNWLTKNKFGGKWVNPPQGSINLIGP